MEFEWDENKNQANLRKHGISFSRACEVFADPNHLSVIENYYDGEERWRTLGMTKDFLAVVVISVYRDTENIEVIRIVSARRADRRERSAYVRAIGEI